MDNVEQNIQKQHDPEFINAVANAKFVAGQQLIKNEINNLSKRGIMRALFAALNIGINDSNFKFEKETEAKVAGILAQVLDLRNVILAAKMNNDKKTINNKQGEMNNG